MFIAVQQWPQLQPSDPIPQAGTVENVRRQHAPVAPQNDEHWPSWLPHWLQHPVPSFGIIGGGAWGGSGGGDGGTLGGSAGGGGGSFDGQRPVVLPAAAAADAK